MKLTWERYVGTPKTLYARISYEHGAVTITGLTEDLLIPVQKWCEENNCGCRLSFDTFRFRNQVEMSAFLLKWG